jgi:hypothetical protein
MNLAVTKPCLILQNRALFHAIADAVGCAHTPGDLNRWWRSVRYRAHPNTCSMWKRFAHGSRPAVWIRTELFELFPHLQRLYENPIWSVLVDVESSAYWNQLADTIQIQGRALADCDSEWVSVLESRVDWSCFCICLVIWRTTSAKYLRHRLWVQLNVPGLFVFLSLQPPMTRIRMELYRVLSGEVRLRISSNSGLQRWLDWPDTCQAYEDALLFLNKVPWLNGRPHFSTLLLWNFPDEAGELIVDEPFCQWSEARIAFARSIYKRLMRLIKDRLSYRVSINCHSCLFE